MDCIYANFQVNRFENGFHIIQKLQKCPLVKFSSPFFLPKYATQKDGNSTIEFHVKFWMKAIYGKNNNFKIVSFFTGSSHKYNEMVAFAHIRSNKKGIQK